MEIYINMKHSFIIGLFLLLIFSCDSGNPVVVQCDEGLAEVDGQCFDDCGVLNGDGSSCLCDSMNCDDNNVCTNDSCDPIQGCVHTYNSNSCDDGDVCTLGDVCNEGSCASGSTINCDDSNPCSEDSCDSVAGCTYNYTSNNGLVCDDGDACTSDDVCNEGSCSGVVIFNCP
jgi:hypothetical protein